jgi:4-carboxymuconolactone decarboxylase
VRHHHLPPFVREDEKLIYDVVNELHQTRTISPASYDCAVTALGLEMFIELITVVGFYTTAAMMINAFDAPVPGGARPLP